MALCIVTLDFPTSSTASVIGGEDLDARCAGVTKIVDHTAKWIEANQHLTDSISEIGVGLLALGALKPAAWVLRLLGLGALNEIAAPAAGMLGAGAAAGSMNVPIVDDQGNVIGNWGGKDESANPAASSAYGKDRNNPLNLRYDGQAGAVPTKSGFGAYQSNEMGVAAAEKQLLLYKSRGIVKLSDIVKKWAPPNENDTAGYIAKVARDTGWSPDQAIDVSDPGQAGRLIAAMARRETGDLDPAVVGRGVAAGLGNTLSPPTIAAGMMGAAAVNGHVQVDVHLKGAPPGTTAKVTTTGPVSAPAPTVETPFPGF